MTRITFYRRGGYFYGFEEVGHTGLADAGDDVLCAAISAMTMLIVNMIEVSFETDVQYLIDDEKAKITVTALGALPDFAEDEKMQYAVSGAIKGYYNQLVDISEDYYENLSVEVKDDEDVV